MTDGRPPTTARLVPPLFASAGWGAILVLVGPDAWPLLLGWIAGVAVVALAAARARGRGRLLAGVALSVACVALTWEGGLFFLPSALALVALPVRPADGSPQGA